MLMAEYGKQSRVACIGPAGEKLSLIAGIMTDHGSAAGRSGLGAVMGSKKLKAVVARGTMEVPIADKAAARKHKNGANQSMANPWAIRDIRNGTNAQVWHQRQHV